MGPQHCEFHDDVGFDLLFRDYCSSLEIPITFLFLISRTSAPWSSCGRCFRRRARAGHGLRGRRSRRIGGSHAHVDDAVHQAMREATAMQTWALLQKMAQLRSLLQTIGLQHISTAHNNHGQAPPPWIAGSCWPTLRCKRSATNSCCLCRQRRSTCWCAASAPLFRRTLRFLSRHC